MSKINFISFFENSRNKLVTLIISVLFISCQQMFENKEPLTSVGSFFTIDSLTINNTILSNIYAYYRIGDSLNFRNDTTVSNWIKPNSFNKQMSKGIVTEAKIVYDESYSGNIWYFFPLIVDTSLFGKALCFEYSTEAAINVFINGKLMAQKGKISLNEHEEVLPISDDFFYTTFFKDKNYLIVRISNHKIENAPLLLISILSDERKHTVLKENRIGNAISVMVSILYFTFFIIYFNLFVSDKKIKTNFYFSLFCFFTFFLFFEQTILNEIENYYVINFLSLIDFLLVVPMFSSFICFLHHLVFGKIKKYLKWAIIIASVFSTGYFIRGFVMVSEWIFDISIFAVLGIVIFSTIDSVRVVYIGWKRKITGIKPIIYGVLLSVLLLVVLFISTFFLSLMVGDNSAFMAFALSMTIIPISVSIALAKNYTQTSKQLAIELINVSELSEKTILQEKERQQILASQNEKLEEQVILRTEEIVGQKVEIEKQKLLVEEKNKEITDSISYAKRLQVAILPPDNYWKKHLPESFVMYQPKDIVSGDFYWMESLSAVDSSPLTENHELILFAAADCTGHGVSGAMVSVVCSNALNRTIKEFGITEPGKILDKTRELVLETFAKSESDIKDGMDISLCSLNTKTNELLWSGANNPLWYIRENNLNEIKGDKQPIGKTDNPKPFATQKIQLQKGDTIYILTDGYPDQFGGEKGKKFMYRPLKELLLSIHNKSIAEQQEELFQKFTNWKENIEQTDDVLVIGVKI